MLIAFNNSSSNIFLILLYLMSLFLSYQTMNVAPQEKGVTEVLLRSIQDCILNTYKNMTGFPSALPTCS